MTRLLTDGAEMVDNVTPSLLSAIGDVVAEAPPAGWGFLSNYLYRMSSPSSGTSWYYYLLPSALSQVYIKFRVARHNNTVTSTLFPAIRKANTQLVYLYCDAIGRICLGSGLVTSSFVMQVDTCYCFQIYYKIANAPNGRFVLKVDDQVAPVIDFTGDTQPGADTDFDNIYFHIAGANTDKLYIDDVAINDTAGGIDDSYPGIGIISKIYPIGNGAHNNWHGSDGDDVNNWNLVDEYPKDDDTTYVYRNGADSGTQDQYEMSDDYIDTNRVVTRIWAEARARKTAAVARQLKLGVLPSGGVDQMSAGRDMVVNRYQRVVGNEYRTNPVTTSAWTKADLDAIEFVNEVA